MVNPVPYALTTLIKVKQFLGIPLTTTTFDDALTIIINGTTDYIERFCGKRRFLNSTYTELYDSKGGRTVFFKQWPVTSVIAVNYRSGTIVAPQWILYDANGYMTYLAEGFLRFYAILPTVSLGLQLQYTAGYLIGFAPIAISAITQTSSTATATVASTASMVTGDTVYITGSSISADNAAQVITVVNATTFTYSSSTSGARTLTSALAYNQSAELDITRHTLPMDLTQVATELVGKMYNTRQSQGVIQEDTEGQRVIYASASNEASNDHLAILQNYQRLSLHN